MGRRLDLTSLAPEPVLEAPVPQITHPTTVPYAQVAPNPIVKRAAHDNVADLESMRETQIQPAAVVTRGQFLKVFPEHEDAIGRARYVVVAGTRRRLAAERWDLPLRIDVNDALAATREDFLANVGRENIDRAQFKVLEEAEFVVRLVGECSGSLGVAAEKLGKSKPWISHRVNITKLVPALKALVEAEELPIRHAREIGAMAPDEQEAAWAARQAEMERRRAAGRKATARPAEPPVAGEEPAPGGRPRFAITPKMTVPEVAGLLRQHLGDDGVRQLLAELGQH